MSSSFWWRASNAFFGAAEKSKGGRSEGWSVLNFGFMGSDKVPMASELNPAWSISCCTEFVPISSSPKAFPFSKSWISRDIEAVSRCKLGSTGAELWAAMSNDWEIESSILISM